MWKTININKQNIKAETGKSVLIACPHKSEYDGFCFWHPAKLVRAGRHRGAVSVSYTEDFTFNLKKYGQGRYNRREVIDEIPVAADELEEIFGVMDDNISAPQDDEPVIYTPDPVEPERAGVDPSLRDED